MISFQCKTKDIREALISLKGVHKHKRISNILVTCELTLIDGHVQLAIPGAIFSFNCQTKGTCKATIKFRNLYSIIEHYSYDEIYVEFLEGSIRFGSILVQAKTVFFNTDRILKTIVLPDKFTDLDLILLKNEGYTKEELDFNNLSGMIEMAERRVYYSVRQASLYLREYGIMPKDIKAFLIAKLGVRLDLDEKDVKLLLEKD